MADNRTDQEWATFIYSKISEVLTVFSSEPDEVSTSFFSISDPSDPRFPLAIDHTLLKQDATPAQIDALCEEGVKFGSKSCCVNEIYFKQVAEKLKSLHSTQTIPCSVIGFPLGAGPAESKA